VKRNPASARELAALAETLARASRGDESAAIVSRARPTAPPHRGPRLAATVKPHSPYPMRRERSTSAPGAHLGEWSCAGSAASRAGCRPARRGKLLPLLGDLCDPACHMDPQTKLAMAQALLGITLLSFLRRVLSLLTHCAFAGAALTPNRGPTSTIDSGPRSAPSSNRCAAHGAACARRRSRSLPRDPARLGPAR
jgi:hypothetical protein